MTAKPRARAFHPAQLQILGASLCIGALLLTAGLLHFNIAATDRDIWFLTASGGIGFLSILTGSVWDFWATSNRAR